MECSETYTVGVWGHEFVYLFPYLFVVQFMMLSVLSQTI
jgi:hypothetical protein